MPKEQLEQKTDELFSVLVYCKQLPNLDDLFDKEEYRRIFYLESITRKEYTTMQEELKSLKTQADDVREEIIEIRKRYRLTDLRDCRFNKNIIVETYNEIHIPASLAMIENITALASDKNFYQVYLMHQKLKVTRELFTEVCSENFYSEKKLTDEQKEAIKIFCSQEVSTYKDFFDKVVKVEQEFFDDCQKNYEKITIKLCKSDPKIAMRTALQAERLVKLATREGLKNVFSQALPPMQVYHLRYKTTNNISDYMGIDPEILCKVFQKKLKPNDLKAISTLIETELEKATIFLQQKDNNQECKNCILDYLNKPRSIFYNSYRAQNPQELSECIDKYLEKLAKKDQEASGIVALPSAKSFFTLCIRQ